MWKMIVLLSLGTFVTLLMLATPGSSLECYQCNSFVNKSCEEIDEKEDKIYLQPCEENSTICRTSYQNIRRNYRVVRSCGKHKHKYSCYGGSGHSEDIKISTCECEKDGCNAAMRAESGVFKLASLILLSIYLLR